MHGITLRSSPPPGGARVALIQRLDETVVPHGDTSLVEGDVLLVIAPPRSDLDDLEAWSGPGVEDPVDDEDPEAD